MTILRCNQHLSCQNEELIWELREQLAATQKRCDEAYANVSTVFAELQNISMMTKLGGEVDDYPDVTNAVREIVAERDELRAMRRDIKLGPP